MNDGGERLTDELIEAALRRLPAVHVPRDLEAKLVAGITRAKVTVTKSKTPWQLREWLALGAAIAAVLLVMVSIAAWHAGQKMTAVRGTTSPNANQAVVAISFVPTKETDPCNVLPTLHDWQ
jgi:hypothetical protein